jgi:hypothetical protein
VRLSAGANLPTGPVAPLNAGTPEKLHGEYPKHFGHFAVISAVNVEPCAA